MSTELRGIAAAEGLAMGTALIWKEADFQLPTFTPENPGEEKSRLAEARKKAERQLKKLAEQVANQIGEKEAALLTAQSMFLYDPALVAKAESAIEGGTNAERAWHQACEFFAVQLENLPDETLSARSADVHDVKQRVIEILLDVQSEVELATQAVILARNLVPSQTAALDPSKTRAFCTAEGGPTSHTAILAKALGIPAVVGIGDALLKITQGTQMLVDGTNGIVIADPDSQSLTAFDARIHEERQRHALEEQSAFQPAITLDGHTVKILANVGSVEDARRATASGAGGIGLLRTEFLFINRSQLPGEEIQLAAYEALLDIMEKRPVVVRTLDIGGDKDVPYYNFGAESNPYLGYRAIRISLDHPEDLKTQLRALLRAGAGHDLKIMFPMITSLDEFRLANDLLEDVWEDLQIHKIKASKDIQVGIMVEVPAAALLADQFAHFVDFFSIGTNDLTQYTFAAERGNMRVSHLNDPCHPAILRQINMVVEAAHAAGKWVGVCGEMASDKDAIPLLVGLGVDELSVAPSQIASVKHTIRGFSLGDAQSISHRCLDLESAQSVRKAVKEIFA